MLNSRRALMAEADEIDSDPLFLEVPDRIEGDRIVLRVLQPGEGNELWEAIEESREHLRPWQEWPRWHKSPRHSELAVRRSRINFFRREVITYGIWHRATGQLLGRVQLEDINWRMRTFGLGYWLRASALGHGFVTEAAMLACRLAFEQLGALRLSILVDSANERSAAVARRLEFREEGRLRNERLNSAGQPQDTLVFGLARDHYFKRSYLNPLNSGHPL